MGDTRPQELPILSTALSPSQLVKEGQEFLLKKTPLKTPRVLDPIKTSPFMVPTTIRKYAPTGNAAMGVNPLQAVTNRFPQAGGNCWSGMVGV